MHNKTYYFLTGMPRSGNTLLSALLNQNPKFYSSPLSPISEHIYQLDLTLTSETGLRNKENYLRTENILNQYVDLYYSDVNKDIVFDRQKNWTTPKNMENIIKYINPKPKIIFTVRDYLEVLASTTSLSYNEIEQQMNQLNLNMSHNMHRFDKIAEYLSFPNMAMDLSMLSIRTALLPEYRDFVHFVEYDDLVKNTEKTLQGIYDFLGEDAFEHDLENIKKVEVDNDLALTHNPKTHLVHSEIVPSSTNPRDFFTDFIINKYSGMNIWRNK
jgi:sulfotransferase